MKLHLYVAKSKVLQSYSSSSSSLVLDKILIPEDEHEYEDEYEKNQNPSYPAPSLLIMDFAADIPDLNVGSNPLSPAHPPAKKSP